MKRVLNNIYLDYAAATPLDPAVQKAMEPYLSTQFYNPSATYLAARQIRADINAARAVIGGWLGARTSEIVFTAGGTEANNLAVRGVMQAYPEGNIVVSQIEHDAILQPAQSFSMKTVGVTKEGIIDLTALADAIDDKTVLVSIMYANNEIGTIQPLRQVREVIDQKLQARKAAGNATPLWFHSDACQAANYLDLHVSRLGVDLMTLNAGKIYGPKQVGLLYVKTGVNLDALIRGGGQELNRRSGTENVAGIIGFAKALDIAQALRKTEGQRLQQLARDFIAKIKKSMPLTEVNGSLNHRLPNNIHITIPGTDNERLVMALDEHGIQCAVGSACSASSQEPSHVLKAIGLDDETAHSTLRITIGRPTTAKDLDYCVKTLTEVAS